MSRSDQAGATWAWARIVIETIPVGVGNKVKLKLAQLELSLAKQAWAELCQAQIKLGLINKL